MLETGDTAVELLTPADLVAITHVEVQDILSAIASIRLSPDTSSTPFLSKMTWQDAVCSRLPDYL